MNRVLDISQNTNLTDVDALLKQQQSVMMVIIRLYDGFHDDAKWHSHVQALMGKFNREGEVFLGSYQYLNHYKGRPDENGNLVGGAKEGDDQVVDAWETLVSGGRVVKGPHILDVEKTSSSPFPNDPRDYLDVRLIPAISQVIKYDSREPFVYMNPDSILNYFVYLDSNGKKQSLFNLPKYSIVKKCPLWLADYSKTGSPFYWPQIKALDIWDSWTMWQHAGTVRDWPGANNVDLNWAVGTRGAWKAYIQRTGPVPTESIVDPEPPEPPVPPVTELTALEHITKAKELVGQTSRERSIAYTDLEKVETWVKNKVS